MKHHSYKKSVTSISNSKPLIQTNDYQTNTKNTKLNNETIQNLRLSYYRPNNNQNSNFKQNDINRNKKTVGNVEKRRIKSIENDNSNKHNSLTNSLHQKEINKLSMTKSSKGNSVRNNQWNSSQKKKQRKSYDDKPHQLNTSNDMMRKTYLKYKSNDKILKEKSLNTSIDHNNNQNDKKKIIINQDDDIDTLTKIKFELELMIRQKLEKKKENTNNPFNNNNSPLTHSIDNISFKPNEYKEAHSDINYNNKKEETEECTFTSIDKIAIPSIRKEYNRQSSDDLKQYFRNNKNQVPYEDCIPETYESNITENRNCYNTNNDSIRDINKELHKLISAKEFKDKVIDNEHNNNRPLLNSQHYNKKGLSIENVSENINPLLNMKSTGKFNEIIYWQKKADETKETKSTDNNNKQIYHLFIEDNTKEIENEGEEKGESKEKRNPSRMKNEREVDNKNKESFNNTDDNNLKISTNTFGDNNQRKFINDQQDQNPGHTYEKIQKPNEENKINKILEKIQQLTIQSNESIKEFEKGPKDPINKKINELLNQKKLQSNSRHKVKEELLSIITDTNENLPKTQEGSSIQNKKSFLQSLFQLQTDLIKSEHNSRNISNNNNNNKHIDNRSALIEKNIYKNNDIQTQPQSPITDEFIQKINQKKRSQNNLLISEENDSFYNKLSRNNNDLLIAKTNLALLGYTSSSKKKKSNISTSGIYLKEVKKERLKTNKARSSSVSPQKGDLLYRMITNIDKYRKDNSHIYINQGSSFCSLMPPNNVDKAQLCKRLFGKK